MKLKTIVEFEVTKTGERFFSTRVDECGKGALAHLLASLKNEGLNEMDVTIRTIEKVQVWS